MNMLNILLKMLRRDCLFVCIALISAPVLAGPVPLPANRHVRFDDNYTMTNGATIWTRQGGTSTEGSRNGTNHFYRANAQTNANVQAYVKWSFYNFRVGKIDTYATLSIPPVVNNNTYPTTGGTNWCGYFQNTSRSYIESPIFTNGVGTIYFDICLGEDVAIAPDFIVSIATNISGVGSSAPIIPSDAWVPLPSLELLTTNLVKRSITINSASPMAIRFERTTVNGYTLDDAFVAIDNIRVSEPPADVIIDQGLSPFNVYPSVNANMNVQFRIDNVPGPNTTTSATRTNLLVSRWNYLNQKTTPWVTNTLTCVNFGDNAGNGELWQPETDMRVFADAGDLEYVLLCYFNGSYYEPRDYTVTNVVYLTSENKSPRIYNAAGILPFTGSITNNSFIFPVRLFPSSHHTVTTRLSVNGGSPTNILAMTLVGTNKWQAKYKVVGSNTTNLLWFFEATGACTNAFTTTSETTYWQITSQSRIQNGALPYGDNCGLSENASITNRRADWFGVNVTPGESSYVLFTLDTAKNNYLVGRGEYQNFNDWNTGGVAQNYFTDVDDKEPKTSYSQTFTNGWMQSYYGGISNWFGTVSFTNQTAATRVGPEQVLDQPNFWNAGSFQYVTERTAINGPVLDAEGAGQRRNQGIRLLGGGDGLGLGFFQGSLGQKNAVNGVGTVTYKARLSRPLATDYDYNYNVAYRWTDMMRSNYVIKCFMNAVTASPEAPSISIIAYYQSPRKFYEYRITQLPDARDINGLYVNAGRDGYVVHQIWKWNGNIPPKLLAESKRANTTATAWGGTELSYDARVTDPQANATEFRIYTTLIPAPSVSLSVKFKNTDILFSATNEVKDSLSPILFGGYGFHSADCTLLVPSMTLNNSGVGASDGGGTPTVVIGAGSSNHANEWYWPSEIYSRSDVIFRPAIPALSTTVKVLTGTTEQGPWTPFDSRIVNSYAYQNFSATTNVWNNLCARIQSDDTYGVVIDGVRVGSWRGETMPPDQSSPFPWTLTEGWISYTPPIDNWFAHLDASQADPSKIQGVRSERIRGLGSIMFDYRVKAAPAQITIQYTTRVWPSDVDNTGWVDITNLTFASGTGWTNANYYLAIEPATNLYVRIINNIETNRHASVDLKNIVIWNNPTNSPNNWVAYNMKISENETDKWWLDKKTEATPRSGYMNNSKTDNIFPGRPMDMYNPYIIAPSLTRGLGTISLLARAYTTNYVAGNTNTSITVYATTDTRDAPSAVWTPIHTFTGITNGFYRPFFYSHPIVPNDIKAVKLEVNGVITSLVTPPQRVCIDEVAVTEAIYPRFDITSVKMLLPGAVETRQPLEGEDIGIQAQLSNVLMEPTDIRVFVTYVMGAATWGVTNAPVAFTNELSLVDETNRIYRTTGDYMTTGIPEQEKYNVVQYLVWATYVGNGFHTIYQTPYTADHFTNPSWYYPVDFNKQGNVSTGAPKATWSPYYITYDVPPGSVWINEINLYETTSINGPTVFLNPYIEIAQPAWVDLTGWRMEILSKFYETRLAWNIVSQVAIQPALGANGYGLFVIGPSETTYNPTLSTTTTVHQSVQYLKGRPVDSYPYFYPGGFRLKRPMGMYEHAVAYDWDRASVVSPTGDTFVENEVPKTPFKYVGREHANGSLSFTGTIAVTSGQYVHIDNTNTWAPGLVNYNWTPGLPNIGQTFPLAPTPGGSNVLITSTFVSPDGLTHGWQNDSRQNPLMFKMKKGEGTNFVFVADPWFRFYGITSNNVQILSLAEQTAITNYVLNLNNIQKSINLTSSIKLAPNVINLIKTPDMFVWLTNFVDRPLAPSYFESTTLSFLEQYWLDLDPTKTNILIFRQEDIVPDPKGVWLTLKMATIDEAGTTNKVEGLRGDAAVSVWALDNVSPDYRPFGQYWISPLSFDDNFKSRTRINAYTNDAAFKWLLDVKDQRLSTSQLTNCPSPPLP